MLNSIFPFFLSLYHLFAFITILIPLVLPYQWYSHLIKVGDEGVIPQSVDNYGCMIVGSKRYLTGVQFSSPCIDKMKKRTNLVLSPNRRFAESSPSHSFWCYWSKLTSPRNSPWPKYYLLRPLDWVSKGYNHRHQCSTAKPRFEL